MTRDKIRNSDDMETNIADKPRNHPTFWFRDGSIVLQAQKQLFRVHHSFLSRLSPFFAALKATAEAEPPNDIVALGDKILAHDLEVLLEHLYHDIPLSATSSIDRFVSILHISSPRLLDFPTVHATAKEVFVAKFPHGPLPSYRPNNILEALALATEYRLEPVRKILLYNAITSNEFDFLETTADEKQPQATEPALEMVISPQWRISASDSRTCFDLMNKLIEYFTPVLFTPATTPHIHCTDVCADAWMPLVVQPAIENEGVAKPLETLEQMKLIDWAGQGLCASCVVEKRAEWTAEQHTIWSMMDAWLKVD